jgi:small conductance mechanosensitive channel
LTLIIPNGQIIGGIVTNYSLKENIRMELQVTMPYSEDFPKVRDIILKELLSIEKVLKTPLPDIGIENFDSHNIIVSVRPYVIPDNYWEVYYEAYAKIKAAFSKNQIQVAYSEGVELGSISY